MAKVAANCFDEHKNFGRKSLRMKSAPLTLRAEMKAFINSLMLLLLTPP